MSCASPSYSRFMKLPKLSSSESARSALQRLEPVVGRVLVGVAEGGVVEDHVDERVDGAAGVEHHEPDVDELRRALADDVDAEQGLVGGPEHELDQASEVATDLAARVLLVQCPTHAVFDALLAAALLRLAGHGELGDRVNGERQDRIQPGLVPEVEGMDHGHSGLLHRGRGQGGEADDVPGGIDVRDRRLVPVIDGEVTSLADGKADALEPETSGIAEAPGRDQDALRLDRVPALQAEEQGLRLGL